MRRPVGGMPAARARQRGSVRGRHAGRERRRGAWCRARPALRPPARPLREPPSPLAAAAAATGVARIQAPKPRSTPTIVLAHGVGAGHEEVDAHLVAAGKLNIHGRHVEVGGCSQSVV